MTKRQTRLQAVQILYLMRGRQISALEALESYTAMGYELNPVSKDLVQQIDVRINEIDDRLQRVSSNWRIDRMSWVDVSILRLGVLELLEEMAPRAVVIDEAVEIAKTLGSEDSPRFINGVLDQIYPSGPL